MKITLPQRFSVRTLAIVVTLFCIYLGAWEATKKYGTRAIVRRFNPSLAQAEWFENSFSRMVEDGIVSSPAPFVVSHQVFNANGPTGGRDYYLWFFGKTREKPFLGESLAERHPDTRSPFTEKSQPIDLRGPLIRQPKGTRQHRVYAANVELLPPMFPDPGDPRHEAPFHITFLHPNHQIRDGFYAREVDGLTMDSFAQDLMSVSIVGTDPVKKRVFGRVKLWYGDPKEEVRVGLYPQWVDVREISE